MSSHPDSNAVFPATIAVLSSPLEAQHQLFDDSEARVYTVGVGSVVLQGAGALIFIAQVTGSVLVFTGVGTPFGAGLLAASANPWAIGIEAAAAVSAGLTLGEKLYDKNFGFNRSRGTIEVRDAIDVGLLALGTYSMYKNLLKLNWSKGIMDHPLTAQAQKRAIDNFRASCLRLRKLATNPKLLITAAGKATYLEHLIEMFEKTGAITLSRREVAILQTARAFINHARRLAVNLDHAADTAVGEQLAAMTTFVANRAVEAILQGPNTQLESSSTGDPTRMYFEPSRPYRDAVEDSLRDDLVSALETMRLAGEDDSDDDSPNDSNVAKTVLVVRVIRDALHSLSLINALAVELRNEWESDPDLMPNNRTLFSGDIADELRRIHLEMQGWPRSSGTITQSVIKRKTVPHELASVVTGVACRLAVLNKLGLLTPFHFQHLVSRAGALADPADPLVVATALLSETSNVAFLPPQCEWSFSPSVYSGPVDDDFHQTAQIELAKETIESFGSDTFQPDLPHAASLLFDVQNFDDRLVRLVRTVACYAATGSTYKAEVLTQVAKNAVPGDLGNPFTQYLSYLKLGPADHKPDFKIAPHIHKPVYLSESGSPLTNERQSYSNLTYVRQEATLDLTVLGIDRSFGQRHHVELNEVLTFGLAKLSGTVTNTLTPLASITDLILVDLPNGRFGPKSPADPTGSQVPSLSRVAPLTQPTRYEPSEVNTLSAIQRLPLRAVILSQALRCVGYKKADGSPFFPGAALAASGSNSVAVAGGIAPVIVLQFPARRDEGKGAIINYSGTIEIFAALLHEAASRDAIRAVALAYDPNIMRTIRTEVRARR